MSKTDDKMQLNGLLKHFKVKFTVPGFFLGKLDRSAFVNAADKGVLCRSLFIFIIVTKGQAEIVADGNRFRIDASGENMAFIYPHSTLNSVGPSHDCDGVLIAANDFFMVSNINFIKFHPDFSEDPLLQNTVSLFSIEKKRLKTLSWYFVRFVANIRDKDHLYWSEKLRLNAIEIYLEIMDIINKDVKMRDVREDSRRVGDIFKRFFISVNKNVTEHREVSFYAEELCISPKYLNVICKKITSNSASTLIDHIATKTASSLLRDQSLSIGQVSGMMNFKEQAAFTKFFKKMTGMTPTGFRYEY